MRFNNTVSVYSGEPVNLFRVKCKCGHTLNFIRNHPQRCTFCGRVVYPSKRTEFKEKLLKKIKRSNNNESSNINR